MAEPAWFRKVNDLGGRLRLLPKPDSAELESSRTARTEAPAAFDQPHVTPTAKGLKLSWQRLVLCVLSGFLAYAGGRQILLGLAPAGREVTAEQVKQGPVSQRVPTVALGRVTAERELSLRAEFSARINKLNFRVGERVRAGEPLLALEALSDLRGNVATAERALSTAQSQIGEAAIRAELARRKEARALPLAESGVLSQADAEQLTLERRIAAKTADSLRARARELEVGLSAARRSLSRSQLRAPFDALVLSVFVEEGQAVLPGAELLLLADDSALHVSANVDEADLGALQEGSPVELSFEAFDEPPIRRKLSRIDPSVLSGERGGRVVGIRVDLENSQRLRVGMGVHLDVIVAERQRAVLAPVNALLGSGATRSAFVVENGEAHLRTLSIGIANWESAEVLRGLTGGELVLLNPGTTGVEEGQRIHLKTPQGG
jgi:RND family efflux transporter MFP subunit